MLPCQFKDGKNADSLGLTGKEQFSIDMAGACGKTKQDVEVTVFDPVNNKTWSFTVMSRLDTDPEL